MQYLFVASGSITLFILSLIFGKKEKARSDYILSVILVIVLFNFVGLFLLNAEKTHFARWEELIFEFNEASIFLYGPLLWFYTHSLTKSLFEFTTKDLPHSIPFATAIIYLWLGVLIPIQVNIHTRNGMLVLKLLSVATYIVLSLRLLATHEKKIQHIFSNLDQKKLTWLRFLCQGILAIVLIAALSLIVDRFTGLTIPQYGGALTNTALCAFVYALGYFGFRQEFIFQPAKGLAMEKLKYAKSGLDRESSAQAYEKLVGYIRNEKPFLNPNLTLFGLAEKLDLQPNHLSQIINSYSGSNFYDFINQYRVEEAKKRISSNEIITKTLLGIGLSSGFSSKTTFNRAFKKQTGLTPSEYLNLTPS